MVIAAALWGASYMFIKVALDDGVSEGTIIFVRTLLGAAVLLPLAVRAGALQPLIERGWWNVVLAGLQVIVPFGLITWGENKVPSALAGILVASSPLFIALLAMRFDDAERARGWRLVGVLLGMAGVVLLFGVDLSGDSDTVVGGLMILGAALSYATAALVMKRRFTGVPSVGVAASTIALSAVAYLPLAAATWPSSTPGLDTIGSLIVLGAGGTGIAFLLYYALIAEFGPARAAVIAYIAPAFAVVYGVTLLDERLTLGTVAGLLLILAGSWLAAQGGMPRWLNRSGLSRSSERAPVRVR
jgi:drug/metabolite transporter (DMT)-like permease